MRRNWVKIWVDQTLRGSTIAELKAEQRWQWIALIAMGGDSSIPGVIFRRKDENGGLVGYSTITLAETMDVELGVFEDGLRRMVDKGKIRIDEAGVISIVNWEKYQSEYLRQKPYRAEKKADGPGDKSINNEGDAIEGEGDRERDREEEKNKGVQDPPASPSKKDLISDIREKWNRFAKGHQLPAVRFIPPGSTRERAILARAREKGFDFEEVLKAVHEQPFLYGDNDRGWLVTLDWIMKPANMVKTLERAYVREVRGRARDRQPDDPGVGGRR